MAEQIIESLVEGGKATAGPPLGPALGPIGVNIGGVIKAINDKTAVFKGMQVPVKVIIDTDSKEFNITVGTPPASALIKKEAGIAKGSGNPLIDKVADLKIEQIIKIVKMKEDSILGVTTKNKVKEVIGTCNSMGVMVEGMPAKDAIAAVNEGNYDVKITQEKTELTAEELKQLDEERKHLEEDIKKRKAEYEVTAKEVINKHANKSRSAIKTKLLEAGIPSMMIDDVLPADAGKAASTDDAAPAAADPKA